MSEERLEAVIGLKDNISATLQRIKNNVGSFNENVKLAKRQLENLEAQRLQRKVMGLDTSDLDEAIDQLQFVARYRIPNREIHLDSSDVEDAVEDMEALGESAENTAGILDRLKGVAAGLAIGAAVKSALTAGINYNATMESYTTAFSTMLGSAEEADALMDDLRDKAATTPFELSDLTEATQLLMNYGLTAQQATDRMMMLGDISQGNAEKMNRIATAYGQMSSAGKVSLEDVKQMIEAGFNPLSEIAETTGESMASLYDRISKGTITVDEITDSMTRATSEGGKYFQSMEAQSQTFNGMLSTLKDNFAQLGGQATEGIFDGLKGAMQGVMGEMQRLSETGEFQSAMRSIGSALGTVVNAGAGLVKMLWDSREAVKAAAVGFGVYKTVMLAQKGWQTVTGIYNGLRTAIIAVKAARDADKTSTIAQTLEQAKNTVAKTAGAAANAAETASETADTAATTANTGATLANTAATNTATVATKLLAAAQAATPWGIFALAIGAVVGGIALLTSGSNEAAEATKQLREELAGSTRAYEDAVTAARDSAADQRAELETVADEIERINDLARSGASKLQIQKAVDNLAERVPEVKKALEGVTKEWGAQYAAVQKVTQEMSKQIDMELAKEEWTAAKKQVNEKSETLNKAIEERDANAQQHSTEYLEYNEKKKQLDQLNRNAQGGIVLEAEGKQREDLVDRLNFLNLQFGFNQYDEAVQTASEEVSAAKQNEIAKANAYNSINAPEEQPEEPAYDPAKYTKQYEAATGEAMAENQADVIRLSALRDRLAANPKMSGEELAGLVGDARQYGFLSNISDKDAKSASKVQEGLDSALQKILEDTAQNMTEAGDTIVQGIDTEMAELNEELDGLAEQRKMASDEEKEAMNGQITELKEHKSALETQKSQIITATGNLGTVFATSSKEQAKASNDLAATIRNWKPGSTPQIGTPATDGHASGTSWFAGGETRINEQGDELIELPMGSKIYPAQQTGRMMQEIRESSTAVYITGNNFTIREEADIDRIASAFVEKLNRQRLIM